MRRKSLIAIHTYEHNTNIYTCVDVDVDKHVAYNVEFWYLDKMAVLWIQSENQLPNLVIINFIHLIKAKYFPNLID